MGNWRLAVGCNKTGGISNDNKELIGLLQVGVMPLVKLMGLCGISGNGTSVPHYTGPEAS
jgi:hypothetical protein